MGLIAGSVTFTQRVTSPMFSETSINVFSNPTIKPVIQFNMKIIVYMEEFVVLPVPGIRLQSTYGQYP